MRFPRGTPIFLIGGGFTTVTGCCALRAVDDPARLPDPDRRAPRRNGERSNKVVYAIVKRIAARIGIEAHPHALRAAFAVRFDEQTSDVMALKDLLGHTRLETTQVYLRRRQKQVKMEKVRGLSWGSVLQPLPVMPPTGFEPVLQP